MIVRGQHLVMEASRKSPGPAADRAFRTGVRAAAAGALAGLALLYWFEVLSPFLVGVTLVVLFPVYMLVVASALSVWLGYDRSAADLRRVRRTDASQSMLERESP